MRGLIDGGKPQKQKMPDKTEADIQAEIRDVVISYGFDCRLEYRTVAHEKKSKHCRIDVVGFDEDMPVVVFEVKTPQASKITNGNCWEQTRRVTWFFNNGLPASVVTSAQEADDFIRRFVV